MNRPDRTKTEHGTLDGTASYWEFGHGDPFKLLHEHLNRNEALLFGRTATHWHESTRAGGSVPPPLEESENNSR